MSSFLNSFMQMRRDLRAKEISSPPPARAAPSLTPMPPPVVEEGPTMRSIIEEKPPAKEVLEFFRMRVKMLNSESSSDSD